MVFTERRGVGGLRLQATALGFAVAVAAIDQATKALARAHLDVAVDLTSFLALRLGFNPGVTFGLFAGSGDVGRWTLSVVSLLIIAVLSAWAWRTRTPLLAAGLSLLVGGAFGNLLDRLRFGAVTDFIDLHWGDARWPTFNLADTAIVCGVGLILLASRSRTAAEAQ
ncbi:MULTISPECIES: signal peptidase II [Brevundimonas]|jgi:signal peptidase II|uniref:signal peptidase II n=1 Tax=Brevundimonas sp. TaxID=1871086 RepID=UPI000BD78DBD|nr:signal peptidase II [Brevundimonas sp.]MCG2663580.1 signal peptidase II [Brevundimonas sp.]OYX18211.1 MAG: signal peptidase II [Brevundimonas diminuta]